MAKRITYSIPLCQVWKEYKKWCKVSKSTDGEQFFEELRLLAYKDQNITTRTATLRMASFWLNDYRKEILHVWFDDKELFGFLRDEVSLKDLDGIKTYLAQNGEPEEMPDPSTGKPYKWIKYLIGIHIPNEVDGFVFGFSLDLQRNEISLYICTDDGGGQIDETEYEALKDRTDWEAENIKKNFKFAINLIAYMECFPECVRDGVPDTNNINTYRYKDRSVQLGVSDKITETVKGAMRPHFRRGYIKYLSSDFYKNKQGQLIFVSETMVNAKSKTVEMSDDKKKIQDFQA